MVLVQLGITNKTWFCPRFIDQYKEALAGLQLMMHKKSYMYGLCIIVNRPSVTKKIGGSIGNLDVPGVNN